MNRGLVFFLETHPLAPTMRTRVKLILLLSILFDTTNKTRDARNQLKKKQSQNGQYRNKYQCNHLLQEKKKKRNLTFNRFGTRLSLLHRHDVTLVEPWEVCPHLHAPPKRPGFLRKKSCWTIFRY